MIVSFADKATASIFLGKWAKRIPNDVQKRGQAKLQALHASTNINELRIPPSNHLEKLTGDRQGQYSIRINQQWRICFSWIDNNAYNVEITDYH